MPTCSDWLVTDNKEYLYRSVWNCWCKENLLIDARRSISPQINKLANDREYKRYRPTWRSRTGWHRCSSCCLWDTVTLCSELKSLASFHYQTRHHGDHDGRQRAAAASITFSANRTTTELTTTSTTCHYYQMFIVQWIKHITWNDINATYRHHCWVRMKRNNTPHSIVEKTDVTT